MKPRRKSRSPNAERQANEKPLPESENAYPKRVSRLSDTWTKPANNFPPTTSQRKRSPSIGKQRDIPSRSISSSRSPLNDKTSTKGRKARKRWPISRSRSKCRESTRSREPTPVRTQSSPLRRDSYRDREERSARPQATKKMSGRGSAPLSVTRRRITSKKAASKSGQKRLGNERTVSQRFQDMDSESGQREQRSSISRSEELIFRTSEDHSNSAHGNNRPLPYTAIQQSENESEISKPRSRFSEARYEERSHDQSGKLLIFGNLNASSQPTMSWNQRAYAPPKEKRENMEEDEEETEVGPLPSMKITITRLANEGVS